MPAADQDPDPYISCSNILDKFSNGKDNYGLANGSPQPATTSNHHHHHRKANHGGIKDFLLGKMTNKKILGKIPNENFSLGRMPNEFCFY